MIQDVFSKDIVKEYLEKISKIELSTKQFPYRVCEEKINPCEYLVYTAIDAIMKYAIIIEDEIVLPKFLDKLYKVLKKVDTYNEISLGINKLIVKTAFSLYGISDTLDIENKKLIINFIYEKYILNGYFYHAFPSIYLDSVKENGLNPIDYLTSIEELREIDYILSKYGNSNTFSKKLDSKGIITFTDSSFMAGFYSNNSPLYLQELCENIYMNISKKFKFDCFVLKNYSSCIKNIESFCRNNYVNQVDKSVLINFFTREWENLKIKEAKPIVCAIERKIFNKNITSTYHKILTDIENIDIYQAVSKILDTKYNEEIIDTKIDKNNLIFIEFPRISDYYKIEEKEKKIENNEDNNGDDIKNNEYGTVTLTAIVGVVFIFLGLLLVIIRLEIGV